MTEDPSQISHGSAPAHAVFADELGLADAAHPVFVWDGDLRGFVWANNAGLDQWGSLSLTSFRASRLDRAMPAMQTLQELSSAALPMEGVRQILTFWTPRGAMRLTCRCRPIDLGGGGHGLIVEALHDVGISRSCTHGIDTSAPYQASDRVAHVLTGGHGQAATAMYECSSLPGTQPKRVAGFLSGENGDLEGQTATVPSDASSHLPAPSADDHLAMQEIARMLGRPGSSTASSQTHVTSPVTPHEPPVGQNQMRNSASGSMLREASSVPTEYTSGGQSNAGTDLHPSISRSTGTPARTGAQFDVLNHELRTPLNSIIGFAEMMHREQLGPIGHDRYKEYAGDILESARHALVLINDLLDASRAQAGYLDIVPEEINLPDLLGRVIALTTPQANTASVEVVSGYPDEMPIVQADLRALRQVLLNVLTNAFKFTPAGGHVFVSARSSNSQFIIDVRDTGIGMNEQQIAEALKPWVRGNGADVLPDTPVGSGLGLPLVKTLVEAMAGELEITSAPGEGTCVTIRLARDVTDNNRQT